MCYFVTKYFCNLKKKLCCCHIFNILRLAHLCATPWHRNKHHYLGLSKESDSRCMGQWHIRLISCICNYSDFIPFQQSGRLQISFAVCAQTFDKSKRSKFCSSIFANAETQGCTQCFAGIVTIHKYRCHLDNCVYSRGSDTYLTGES